MTLNTARRKGSLKVCLDSSLLFNKEGKYCIKSEANGEGGGEKQLFLYSAGEGGGEKWWNISVSFEKRGSPERG